MKLFLLVLGLVVIGAAGSLYLASQGATVTVQVFDTAREFPLPIAIIGLILLLVALVLILKLLAAMMRALSPRGKATRPGEGRRLSPASIAGNLLLSIIVVAIGGLAAVWVIDNDTTLTLATPNQTVELSFALAVVLLLAAGLVTLWVVNFLAWLIALPGLRSKAQLTRLQRQGQGLLVEGFLAVANGDGERAKALSQRISKLAPASPATLLLAAQAAELNDDANALQRHSHAMVNHPESEVVGLRFLMQQARRGGNPQLAASYAERIQQRQPKNGSLAALLVQLYLEAGAWKRARAAIRQAQELKALAASAAERQMMAAYLAEANDLHRQGRSKDALPLAREAQRREPNSVAAVQLLADIEQKRGNTHSAEALLRKTWARNPHPVLAQQYLQFQANRDPQSLLASVERLVKGNPRHPESAVLLARAALDAGQPGRARKALQGALRAGGAPRTDLNRLMLEVERADSSAPKTLEYWVQRTLEAATEVAGDGDTDGQDQWAALSSPPEKPRQALLPVAASTATSLAVLEGRAGARSPEHGPGTQGNTNLWQRMTGKRSTPSTAPTTGRPGLMGRLSGTPRGERVRTGELLPSK